MLLTYEYGSLSYEVEVPDEMYQVAMGEDKGGKDSYALAQYIEEANWEALELIAEWMERAADNGNTDAIDWLEDYYFSDGACDPYA